MTYNFRLFWRMFYRSFFKSKGTPARLTPKRLIFIVPFFLVWPLGSLVHWFCFFLDDIFFPGHKTQPIDKPLFILGNFRSGSTFLHRLLSRDNNFTSLTIWDIYLAPSVTQKKTYPTYLKARQSIRRLPSPFVICIRQNDTWQGTHSSHLVL